jgi:hypothetical protein
MDALRENRAANGSQGRLGVGVDWPSREPTHLNVYVGKPGCPDRSYQKLAAGILRRR